MARYARAVDRNDMDLLREVYHPDAYDDHGDYKGDLEGLVGFVTDRVGDVPQVMHFLGQCHVELAGPDVAVVETHFMTAHTLGPEAQAAYGITDGAGSLQLSMFGRYVDRVERRLGRWRIAVRDTVFEATRLFTGTVPPINPEWARFRRDHDDPIFRRRREAGL
nr:nuclear transport factor 2 family protein [Pseudonocardia sp. C8]